MEKRRVEIARLAQARKEQLKADDQLQLTREQLYANVSHIIVSHICEAQRLIPEPTEGAKLFHEYNFMRHQWTVDTANGYSSTMPLFHFYFEKVPYTEKHPAVEDVMRFIRDVMDKMQLTTECIVIGLIYLEKVMLTGKIEIRDCNWKPLVFTATLLASKFWEDIIWYNVDFVENLKMYSLKSINRLESEFLSLCNYNIYVSAEAYEQYQEQVRSISFENQTDHRNCSRNASGTLTTDFQMSAPTTVGGWLKRKTSFGNYGEAKQQSYMGTEFSMDQNAPLLSLEQRSNNPIVQQATSITSHQHAEFTIKQSAPLTLSG